MATKRKNPLGGGKMKPSKQVYDILSLGLALDRETKRILEVSCTTLPPYGNEFIRELLLGKKIDEDFKTIGEEIRSHYICRTRNALLAALEDLLKRLREHEKRT